MNTSKAEITYQMRGNDPPKQSSIRGDAVNSITSTAPDIPLNINTNPIGIAIIYTIKIASTCELATTSLHIKNMNQSIRTQIIRGTCIDDIKHRFIR